MKAIDDGPYADLRRLLDAMADVESAGGRRPIGDGGKSLGRYHIGSAYWTDGCEAGGFRWDYHELVWSAPHCERIILHYWLRWCPDALKRRDMETLARVHNGGPRGATKTATVDYWRKIKRHLTTEAQRPLRQTHDG